MIRMISSNWWICQYTSLQWAGAEFGLSSWAGDAQMDTRVLISCKICFRQTSGYSPTPTTTLRWGRYDMGLWLAGEARARPSSIPSSAQSVEAASANPAKGAFESWCLPNQKVDKSFFCNTAARPPLGRPTSSTSTNADLRPTITPMPTSSHSENTSCHLNDVSLPSTQILPQGKNDRVKMNQRRKKKRRKAEKKKSKGTNA